jgi:hypothetical protein
MAVLKSVQYTPPVLYPFTPGEGHNDALWKRGKVLQTHGVPLSEAHTLVQEWVAANLHRFARKLAPGEVEKQVTRAYNTTLTVVRKTHTTPPHLEGYSVEKLNARARVESLLAGYDIAALTADTDPVFKALSSKYWEPKLYQYLFKPTDLVSWSPEDSAQARLTLGPPDFGQARLIVPNAMRAPSGRKMDGTGTSQRCRENAADPETRLRVVCDFDYDYPTPGGGKQLIPKEEQARRIKFLSLFPQVHLELVCDSAGKSLQAWYRVPSSTAAWKDFWELALLLNADKAGIKTEQLFRAPGGWRPTPDGGQKQQAVLHFSPLPLRPLPSL